MCPPRLIVNTALNIDLSFRESLNGVPLIHSLNTGIAITDFDVHPPPC